MYIFKYFPTKHVYSSDAFSFFFFFFFFSEVGSASAGASSATSVCSSADFFFFFFSDLGVTGASTTALSSCSSSFFFFFFFFSDFGVASVSLGASSVVSDSAVTSDSSDAFFFFFFFSDFGVTGSISLGASSTTSIGCSSADFFFFFFSDLGVSTGALSPCSATSIFIFFFFEASSTTSSFSISSAFRFFFFFSFLETFWNSPSSFLMASIASVITSKFFLGISPVSKNFSLSSTCSFNLLPKMLLDCSEKQSILDAMVHLFAKNREIRPLFFAAALPIKEEWKIRPCLGVLPFFFRARKSAFSAPKICTVDAGYLAKLVKDPAWDINLAPTTSPIKAAKFGATLPILSCRYFDNSFRYSAKATTRLANISIFIKSTWEMSIPIDVLEASTTALALAESMMTSSSWATASSVSSLRFLITLTHLANM